MTDLIEQASVLPTNDAAYLLWQQRYRLNRLEGDQSPKKPTDDLGTKEGFARTVRRAFASVTFERDNAQDGPTFRRLKQAHPNVGDESLRQAIKLAVKFDTDCTRYFSYSDGGLFADAKQAVERARADNPGFTEVTYRLAVQKLCEAMR